MWICPIWVHVPQAPWHPTKGLSYFFFFIFLFPPHASRFLQDFTLFTFCYNLHSGLSLHSQSSSSVIDPSVPSLGPSDLPTPPLSPQKRRRHLRESDDAEGDMSLERYLQRVEVHRSTSIPSRFLSPVKLDVLPSLKKVLRPLYSEVSSILNQYNLPGMMMYRC